jgi:hypothetical protein
LGPAAWSELARRTSNIPFVGLAKGALPRVGHGTALRIVSSLILYAALILSHELLAGVPVPI